MVRSIWRSYIIGFLPDKGKSRGKIFQKKGRIPDFLFFQKCHSNFKVFYFNTFKYQCVILGYDSNFKVDLNITIQVLVHVYNS